MHSWENPAYRVKSLHVNKNPTKWKIDPHFKTDAISAEAVPFRAGARVDFPAPFGPHMRMWGISLQRIGMSVSCHVKKLHKFQIPSNTQYLDMNMYIWCEQRHNIHIKYILFVYTYNILQSCQKAQSQSLFYRTSSTEAGLPLRAKPTACNSTKSLAEVTVVIQLANKFKCNT